MELQGEPLLAAAAGASVPLETLVIKAASSQNVGSSVTDDLLAVNIRRSWENMWASCCFQPLSCENPAMMSRQPNVKLRANFEGERTIIGRKSMKASRRRTKPAARKENM
eukprot:1136949-Pelagomonas_calceolata.AAC.3